MPQPHSRGSWSIVWANMKCCFAYIDDINVPSAGFGRGFQRLEQVFQELRLHNFKLNPDKCQFFCSKLLFCGHVISNNGIETDPFKTSKITEWEAPKNIAEVREFLGFGGYYRKFV